MNSDTYNIDLIDSMIFETTDEPDWSDDNMKSSYRLTDNDIADMPDDTRDIDALRCLLSEYFDRFKNGYSELELKCDIKRDTFQRVLKLKNGINITYTLLAKFCYGEVPSVSWTNRFLESYFGKYTYPIDGSEGKDFIKINLVLNSSSVPREVVKYVIYHELLHKNNRTHNSAFREKEHLYPNWTEHERFLENKFPKFNIKYAL